MGLRSDENLFGNADGNWLPGAYVPAYVRRYPFILAEYGRGISWASSFATRMIPRSLCGRGRPLFADGEPSHLVRSSFELCKSLRAADLATAPFVEALLACGVPEGRAATVQLPSGGDLKMAGFATIDEAKFCALPDEAFLLLRRQGWMSAIYAQIQSTLNWSRLGDILVRNDR